MILRAIRDNDCSLLDPAAMLDLSSTCYSGVLVLILISWFLCIEEVNKWYRRVLFNVFDECFYHEIFVILIFAKIDVESHSVSITDIAIKVNFYSELNFITYQCRISPKSKLNFELLHSPVGISKSFGGHFPRVLLQWSFPWNASHSCMYGGLAVQIWNWGCVESSVGFKWSSGRAF